MKVTEEFHSTHCVRFAAWNWVGSIDGGPAVKGGLATDVKMKVVSSSCFAKRERMYLKTTKWLSPEGFGRASSRLHSPLRM
jgi:hypothetical protein